MRSFNERTHLNKRPKSPDSEPKNQKTATKAPQLEPLPTLPDRASDQHSFTREFSPLLQQSSPGLSKLPQSIGSSPFGFRNKIPGTSPFELRDLIISNSRDRNVFGRDDELRTFGEPPSQFQPKEDKHSNFVKFGTLFSKMREQVETSNLWTSRTLDSNESRMRGPGGIVGGNELRPKADAVRHSDSDSPDNESEDEEFDRRKLSKGLKLLSVVVRDIVIERQLTTYKEVADVILKETIKEEHLNTSDRLEIVKEEQNIKRRVYDALNVLIAAGVLQKEGKKVRKSDNISRVIVNLKRSEISSTITKIVNLSEEEDAQLGGKGSHAGGSFEQVPRDQGSHREEQTAKGGKEGQVPVRRC